VYQKSGLPAVNSDSTFTADKLLDAASYDEVAEEFDHLTDRFATPLARKMLSLAPLRQRVQVLDVGTGTGLVVRLAAPLTKGGKVVGIDHSAGMLERARAKASSDGLSSIASFQQMDAESLQFPNQSFDVVFSLFALLHFPTPLLALQEMYRVLRPGGRIVIAVGSGPNALSVDGVRWAIRQLADRAAVARGRLLIAPQCLCRLAAKHGMMRENKAPRKVDIEHLLRQAGFEDLHRCWQGHREILNPDDFWTLQITFASQARMAMQRASTEERAALKRDFLKCCRRVQARGGALVYSYASTFYSGTRTC
jgi:ubiquinone/menaquinone biosynthesis C-methylase UbiE